MQTFKQFLTEISYSGISIEEAAELIKQHCSEYCKISFPIYRGINTNVGVMIGDSAKGEKRKSSSLKTNIYTNYFDKSPAWEGFPKRSKSFICSTSQGTASSYGEVYRVFPYDNAKIAMVPTHDIWYAFKEDMGGLSLSQVQESIALFLTTGLETIGKTPMVNAFNDDLEIGDIRELLSAASLENIEHALDAMAERASGIEDIHAVSWADDDYEFAQQLRKFRQLYNILDDGRFTDFWHLFEERVTPESFQVHDARDAKNFTYPNDKELYIEGNVIFVNEKMVQPLLDHLRT